MSSTPLIQASRRSKPATLVFAVGYTSSIVMQRKRPPAPAASASNPITTQEVSSSDAFVNLVQMLVKSTSDTTEPSPIPAVTPPVSDTTPPVPAST